MRLTAEAMASGSSMKRSRNENTEEYLSRVTHLALFSKNLEAMDDFEQCSNLACLYLYDNPRISAIRGLSRNGTSQLRNLRELFLQGCSIREIRGLDGLHNLRVLNLAKNRVGVVEGLQDLCRLEELYLGKQDLPPGAAMTFDESITAARGTLTTLDVCGNRIEHIGPLKTMDGLQHLDLSENNIRSWEDVSELLERCKNLRSLCIAGNPVSRNLRYRQKIILLSSSVSTVDNKDVNAVERQFLRNWEAMGRKSLRNITESKFERRRSEPRKLPIVVEFGFPSVASFERRFSLTSERSCCVPGSRHFCSLVDRKGKY